MKTLKGILKREIKGGRGLLYKASLYSSILFTLLLSSYLIKSMPSPALLDLNLLFYLVVLLDFFSLAVYLGFDNPPQKLNSILTYTFLFLLAFFATIFPAVGFLSEFQRIFKPIAANMCFLTTGLGLIILYYNKDDIFVQTSSQNTTQSQSKESNNKTLDPTFIIDYSQKRDWLALLILALIISAFVLVRVPYLDKTFGGLANSDKYGTYLPNVINMYEKGSPFVNQNGAYISITNMEEEPNVGNIGVFPFLQWGILIFMPLTEFISLELLVRSLLTAAGGYYYS